MSTAVVSGSAAFEPWRVAYDARGQAARAIVFIHGAGVDRAYWRGQMAGVSTSRRLIAVDLLGHGESRGPRSGYTLDLWARSITAVLDALAVEGAVFVGHSNGVPVARQVYRLFPRRVDGLVLADGALWPPFTPQLVAWFRATLHAPDYPQKAAAMAEQMPRGRLTDADFAYLQSKSASTSREANLGMLDALQDDQVWAADPIAAPLLYIARSINPTPSDYAGKVRALAPHAEIEVLPDTGHFVNLEEPERFNRLVEGFVERVEKK